jgi:hypothetical protein
MTPSWQQSYPYAQNNQWGWNNPNQWNPNSPYQWGLNNQWGWNNPWSNNPWNSQWGWNNTNPWGNSMGWNQPWGWNAQPFGGAPAFMGGTGQLPSGMGQPGQAALVPPPVPPAFAANGF